MQQKKNGKENKNLFKSDNEWYERSKKNKKKVDYTTKTVERSL